MPATGVEFPKDPIKRQSLLSGIRYALETYLGTLGEATASSAERRLQSLIGLLQTCAFAHRNEATASHRRNPRSYQPSHGMMNTLLLQPTDVLFFRDGRPMGGASAGHGAGWPLPTVTDAAFHALHRSDLKGHAHDQIRLGARVKVTFAPSDPS